ncbi:MAG: hypothetical protein KF869_02065 [Phycisphaeraceae bacterium]|nr:hypothetical protein [Phycisphaeraceae bacterium]
MPIRSRRARIETCPAAFSLESLEGRRMLDCTCHVEMIEITRLDGGESFWVRADDPFWGTGDAHACDAEAPHAAETAVPTEEDAGRDDDLYDFGQDRGPEIDDEAEYDTGAHEPVGIEPTEAMDPVALPRVHETVPAQQNPAVQIDEVGTDDQNSGPAGASAISAIAIMPAASKPLWLGSEGEWGLAPMFTSAVNAPDKPLVVASLVGVDAPSWTDLVALPV